MKIRTLFTGLFLAALIALVFLTLIWNTTQGEKDEATQQETTSQPTNNQAANNLESENFVTPTDNGIRVPYQDAPQAVEQETATPTYTHQNITQPTPKKDLDTNDPKAVTTEAITLYTSRTSAEDKNYQKQLKPITTEELAAELKQIRLKPFDGQYPVAVKEVTLGANIKDWGIDTPSRYSHYATATVATEKNGTYELNYRIAAAKTKDGWKVTDLALDTWSKKHD